MPAKKYISKINKDGSSLYIKDVESQDALFYKDIYIGAATQSTTIKTDPYHYDVVVRGKLIPVNAESHKIWMVFPADAEVPTVLMNGMEVPMELHGTTTIDDESYKVYKSQSPYAGTFSVCLM